jgi:hypothetical protein
MLRCALKTGEYVFDFAVVIFGVRLSCFFSARLHGRLPRGLRALTLLTCCTTALELFRAETLGGCVALQHVRTHAGTRQYCFASFCTCRGCTLTSDPHG